MIMAEIGRLDGLKKYRITYWSNNDPVVCSEWVDKWFDLPENTDRIDLVLYNTPGKNRVSVKFKVACEPMDGWYYLDDTTFELYFPIYHYLVEFIISIINRPLESGETFTLHVGVEYQEADYD
jgi:hypothetical protein